MDTLLNLKTKPPQRTSKNGARVIPKVSMERFDVQNVVTGSKSYNMATVRNVTAS